MSKETIISGILGTVFAKTGVALPVILALIAYIGLRLKNVALTPPVATQIEASRPCQVVRNQLSTHPQLRPLLLH
jgi:uncharacterized membrane protein YciS (DUF1049 family)